MFRSFYWLAILLAVLLTEMQPDLAHLACRRIANRESARRVRQKRQDALCVMQDRLEGARQRVEALAAQLQQSEAQRAALMQQADRMRGQLTAVQAENAALVTTQAGDLSPSSPQVPATPPQARNPPKVALASLPSWRLAFAGDRCISSIVHRLKVGNQLMLSVLPACGHLGCRLRAVSPWSVASLVANSHRCVMSRRACRCR